ncbi:MAG: hypothetical protein FWE72_06900 [Spirochaetaceae bacterium]|nr:hypothetical protein [Spirochaetaceae bacterium]
MINELYKLSEAMSSVGIAPYKWHGQLKELRKVSKISPFFKLSLSSEASICNIEEITDQELVNKLRKWEPSNGFSFPVFNMPVLYSFSKEQIKHKDEWLTGNQRFDKTLLKRWCTKETNNWDDKTIEKLEKCFHTVPEQFIQKISNEISTDNNSIKELIKVLGKITVDDFRKKLEEYIFDKLAKEEDLKILLRFLFPVSKDIQIVLDLYNWKPFVFPVANEKSIEWLNFILFSSDKIALPNPEQTGRLDAFGCEYSDISEPMHTVKLAGKVGDVKLRSMFHAHKCQLRYRMIEDGSYPINYYNRYKIKTALEWLKDQNKEDMTWGMVESNEILFVYPSVIPEKPLKLAKLAGTGNINSERFESIAKDVIQTLKGLPPDKKINNIQIFAIRKMDKARTKIVYFRNHNTEQLVKSAEIWKTGCKNIPSVSFRVWPENNMNKEKIKPENCGSEIPMPLQIAKIINKIWKMNGKTTGEMKKIKYYQGLDLLLNQDRYELSRYLMSALLPNSYGLIIYFGNFLHSGEVISPKRFPSENYVFLLSLMGLLLYNQNRVKEEYMEDIPYLIGQMLKISDELHAFYCKIVRGDNIPPQLVGNSLLISALETPNRMLGQMAQRMNPYIAWAKQYRTKKCEEKGKESWRAAWYLGLYEKNASIFSNKIDLLGNIQFGDREKAELFIGYLADFPKKEDSDNQLKS